jgi:predicted dinucleotide-binding enzyme
MRIGIAGTGQIGATLVKQYRRAGHDVKMTNASGLEKLSAIEYTTGARAVSLDVLVEEIDVLVIAIPFHAVPELARAVSQRIADNVTIIDTTNYYPIRDGHIHEIEHGMLESNWVAQHLARPVIKAYNSILAGSLNRKGIHDPTVRWIALPVSGDDAQARQVVSSLVCDSGFDCLEIGGLDQSWKQQPGSPVYCTDLYLTDLIQNVNRARKELLPARRELALQFILRQDPESRMDWSESCVANNRIVFETLLTD